VTEDPKVTTPRGWVSLYAVGFVLLVLAGATLVSAALGFLESTRLLWISIGLSALAIVTAVVGVTLPRR
jgi:hypothetical protein